MSTKIKAVLFDMDGVLIDAREWHYEALNMALAVFGLNISRYDHLVTFDGLPTSKKLHMMSAERGLPQRLHELIGEIKQQHTQELIYAHCRPQFAQQFALSRLQSSGYRMAVCSNSIRSSVEMMLSRADLLRYLDFFLSSQDVAMPKPAPDIYRAAIERLGLLPSQCLVVEDNHNGVAAARAAGAHVLQVAAVEEVHLENILGAIARAEQGVPA
jgi:beta-phosphoglucomutase